MKPLFHKIVLASIAAGLSLLACVTAGAQEDSVGFVRITQPKASEVLAQQVTPASFHHGARQSGNCDFQTGAAECPSVYRRDWRTTGWNDDCWGSNLHRRTLAHSLAMENAWCGICRKQPGLYYHDATGQDMCDYFRCKFGYFIPTGAGGAGVPWVGKYSRVYPQDPYYFDQRDGQTWAAQGYGAPIAVPLAPVVGHTYNYGWGIPSSRLSPVSRPAY